MATFDLVDYTKTSVPAIDQLLVQPGVTHGGTVQIVANEVVLLNEDAAGSWVLVKGINIPQRFTFESEFVSDLLPPSLSDLNASLFFIAVYDKQDNAGGILLSQQGIAIVSTTDNAVMPIAGSQSLFEEAGDYTIRMVVDGLNDVMDLYVTKTVDLLITGHKLVYTTTAPISPASEADSIYLEVLGTSPKQIKASFSSLRLASSLIIPNKRPIANTGRDQTANREVVVQMDGSLSYDPENLPITYQWSLISCPTGSEYKTTGSAGFTGAGGPDGLTEFFEGTGNPWDETNCPALQPGDILIVDDVQYVLSTTNWVWNAVTLEWDRGGGFDPNKIEMTLDAIPENQTGLAWEIYHQTPFFFDRTEERPTWIPDVAGLYDLQLVVNDGSLDSLPATGLVNISDNAVPLGFVPDLSFLWDYIGDFWALVDDREIAEVFWSGFSQTCTAILMAAWQMDYGKSLKDIPRQFQRRWLGYSTLVLEGDEDEEKTEIVIRRGRLIGTTDIVAGANVNGLTIILTKDGGTPVTTTFSGTNPISPADIVAQISAALGETGLADTTAKIVVDGGTHLIFSYDQLLVLDKDGTANTVLGFSTTVDSQNDLSGTNGAGDIVASSFFTSEEGIDFSEVDQYDLLSYSGRGFRALCPAVGKEITLIDPPNSAVFGPWVISSHVRVPYTDFDQELVNKGDIAYFDVRRSGQTTSTEIACQVTGAAYKVLGFDPRPLLEAVGGDISSSTYNITFVGVRRCNAIAVDDLVVSVPRLQEILLDPNTYLTQNQEFTISSEAILDPAADAVNGIRFVADTFDINSPPPDILWAEITYLNNEFVIEANFGKAIGLPRDRFLAATSNVDYLSAVKGMWYAFFSGPSLFNIRLGTQILLGLPFAEVKSVITEIHHTYSTEYIRMLLQDYDNPETYRSYFIPRSKAMEASGESMIALDPDTGVEWTVGDTVPPFYPLSKGVENLDYVEDPDWWRGLFSCGKFYEIEKFHKFMIRADVDVFTVTNLVFAGQFVREIKPGHTLPLLIALKRVTPTPIDVADAIGFKGILHLFDDPTCLISGSYRWDDTNESGIFNFSWDSMPPTSKPTFLYDKRNLCPREYLAAHMIAVMPLSPGPVGGAVGPPPATPFIPWDWIWGWDGGGGLDVIPLSGPDILPPPPYGPEIQTHQIPPGAIAGQIQWDGAGAVAPAYGTYPAGTYHRVKVLKGTP